MKPMTVATRLAWGFGGLFMAGLLLVSSFAYYELVVEPVLLPGEQVSLPHVMAEIAAEATLPVALLCLGGWWLARRAMRPLEILARAASQIHEGNLQEPIRLPGADAEFSRLAEVLNAMTTRLDRSFQGIRQFTLYASHELKTPLAVLHGEFERLLDDPARSDLDRTAFTRNLDEIGRLSQIVDGLAFLTRADSKLIPLNLELVSLKALITAAAEDAIVLGAEKQITVTLARCDEVAISGDRHRLRQLLVILCDNAIKYNRPGGAVELRLSQSSGAVALSVTNTGPGIPPHEHDRVFERFYRGSNVLVDHIDGTGLGLNIAQWIATAHEGTLSFTSDGDRTEFCFRVRQPPL